MRSSQGKPGESGAVRGDYVGPNPYKGGHMRTTTVESVNQVEDEAAAWLVRRDSGEWTTNDQQALDEWLDASTAHMVAFIRLEALWNQTPQLTALRARQG